MKVSEHAVLRYLQRVMNIDISKIKSEIIKKVTSNSSERQKIGKNLYAIVKDNQVITIIYEKPIKPKKYKSYEKKNSIED